MLAGRRWWRTAFALSLVLGAIAACTIVDIDFTGRRCPCVDGFVCSAGICVRPGDVDASRSDASPAEASTEICTPRHPPDRPSKTADEPRLTFTTALRRADLKSPEGVDVPYWDLDGVCTTCPDAAATASCVGKVDICDDPGGVDRALNAELEPFFASTNRDFTSGLVNGVFGMLVRVSDYNGLKDDERVYVDVFLSAGLEASDAASPIPPAFDGTDVFTVLATSGTDANPRWRTTGWVSGGQLVAMINGTVELEAPMFALPINETQLVANIEEKDGKRFLSRGTWSGRVKTDELLTGVANLAVQGAPLCSNPGFFNPIRDRICKAQDIRQENPAPPGLPCNAISVAMALEGAPIAALGRQVDPPREPPPCGPDYKVSCD